jgi:hypothetical protein
MKIVIFGLTISSSWGNGHATVWRGLGRALHVRGHQSAKPAEKFERVLDTALSATIAAVGSPNLTTRGVVQPSEAA